MKRYLCFLSLLFIFFGIILHAEDRNISISGGLSTITFFNNSPSAKLMMPSTKDGVGTLITGGSYDGQQSGIALRAAMILDKDKNLEIPLTLYFSFLRAAERAALGIRSELYLKHKTNVQSVGLGFNYYVCELPISGVKPYIGAEAIASYINEDYFERKIVYSAYNEVINIGHDPKKAAFRMGGEFKIGILGNIINKVSLNSSIGINAINLLGRDDSRGELLTPNKDNESKESMVWNWHFTLMIQYAL